MPTHPRRVSPAPPLGAPDWAALPATARDTLIARGEAALTTPAPQILGSDYARYARDGNRAAFEALYFARRRRLNALIMGELACNDGHFLPAITDAAYQICEESGWQLPAHNAQVRGGARAALPDPASPVIDLFAAETGAQLATLLAVMGPALDATLPGLPARIEAEITQRILRPYLTRDFWWMGHVDGPTNNWTVWCTQNVLLATQTLDLPPDTRAAVLTRVAASIDAFLADYGDDGACEEGALYYRHAGLCLWGALHLAEAAAPGAFAPTLALPKLRNIAEYIEAVHVAGRQFVNFADCGPVNAPCTIREVLFARATGSARLERFALCDAISGGWSDLPDEINLWYRLLQALHAKELSGPAPTPLPPRDTWYPSVGLMIARDDTFTLAAKAGDNGDSHNHNDVGSVTLYKHGHPVLIDVGVGTYTARTFSAQRYEIWTMQSSWHNLPDFGGAMQRDGADFAARAVVPRLATAQASLEMELSGAWPEDSRPRRFHRTVTLAKGSGAVTLYDQYDSDAPAVLNLMLAAEPQVEEGALILPGLARIAITGGARPVIEAVPIDDARLRESWPATLWRARIAATGPDLTLTIR